MNEPNEMIESAKWRKTSPEMEKAYFHWKKRFRRNLIMWSHLLLGSMLPSSRLRCVHMREVVE